MKPRRPQFLRAPSDSARQDALLKNVRVQKKTPFEEVPAVQKAVKAAEKTLHGRGRVLLRYSGTEPVARVMVEGEDRDKVEQLVQDLVETLTKHLK